MLTKLSFKSRRSGRQPRANIFVRLGRYLRRKRVAYARTGAAHALNVAQKEVARFHQLAAAYDVPVEMTAPLPVLPDLPGQDWLEVRRAMGELKDPVRPSPEMARA